jgi:hypothetical protein
MKKLFTILALALAAFCAQAQTVIDLTGSVCNVAQTVCSITSDPAHSITFTFAYNTPASTVTLTVDGQIYTGTLVLETATVNTLYYRTYPFSSTLFPTAVLEGSRYYTRSGSGRGGWAWHSHWQFDTLTVY